MVEMLDQVLFLEKYRPNTLEEVRGHGHHVRRLKNFIKHANVQHCIFAGPQGVGKTTIALALARQLYEDTWRVNFKEMNASDSRGIDVVRNVIKNFAEAMPVDSGRFRFKIMFLDESDELTKDAQAALRRTMEKYSNTCRFILGCNWPNKIIDPIKSRCAVFRFTKLTDDDLRLIINDVITGEELKISKSIIEHLVQAADGDARIAVNALQELSYIDSPTIEDTRKIVTSVDRALVKKFLETALEGSHKAAVKIIDELIYNYGYSGTEIIEEAALMLEDWPDLDKQDFGRILYKMGQVDHRIHEGRSERVQLRGLVGFISLLKYTSSVCPKMDIEE